MSAGPFRKSPYHRAKRLLFAFFAGELLLALLVPIQPALLFAMIALLVVVAVWGSLLRCPVCSKAVVKREFRLGGVTMERGASPERTCSKCGYDLRGY